MDQKKRSAQLKRWLQDIRELMDKYPGLTHTWRFATSAVWAMEHYYELNALCPQRTVQESTYEQDTKKNIDALIEDKTLSQDYERGFWFNSAIMRLDALWERLFKLFIPSDADCNGCCLYSKVHAHLGTTGSELYKNSRFGQVRKIVNQLKHEPGGAHPSIRENSELPFRMLDDLLAIIRNPVFANNLEAIGKGPVVTGRSKRKH